MRLVQSKLFKTVGSLLLALLVLAGLAAATDRVHMPWSEKTEQDAPPAADRTAEGVTLVGGKPHTLFVPEDVRRALGIRHGNVDLIAEAKKPTRTRALTMPGSTALDDTRLIRIRARFAPSPSSAEVIQIGQVAEDPLRSGKTETVLREIRTGDRVIKGDLLAVFNSVDVGNKKNDLIDALYQLKLDSQILARAEAKAEVVTEVFLLNARKSVQSDINAINRAESTLRTWGIPEEDIQAVRDEAKNVEQRGGKHDKSKDALWARVEIKAPDDGIIIERNVEPHYIVADNTTNLFQIARLENGSGPRLRVNANVPEDELPALNALPTALMKWTVRTVGSPPIPGFITDIGYIIDPNDHSAKVKGYIDNKEGNLRAGQFVSATVELPPPADVVQVPIDAVVEDGQQCIVFVQPDPKKEEYTMRRVQLTHRFDKTAFVRSKPFRKGQEITPEEAELGMLPKQPLHAGERLVQSGVGQLKAVLLDKESQPQTKTAAR